MKRREIIVILTLSVVLCHASTNEEYSAGLLFGNRSHPPATALDLTRDGPLHLGERFSLSFELAIWDDANFGYVFWAEGISDESIVLSYVDFEHADTSFLVLPSSADEEVLRMPVAKSSLGQGRWHSVTLEFDLTADRIVSSFDDEVFEAAATLKSSTDLSLLFGFRNEPASVPRMALRHIKVFSEGKENPDHHWPLAEHDGEQVHDVIGGHHGNQNGGEWLAHRHTRWRSVAEMTRPRGEFPLIDPTRQRVLFVTSERLVNKCGRIPQQ